MKLLFCVQFYFPSIGGVQEVVRQLAERLAAKGHDVTVATASHDGRNFAQFNSVSVRQFSVSGNRVQGMVGEVDAYRQFLVDSDFDLVFFYAAQQWAFDAAWEVMDCIKGKKVLVPCGYSALHVPTYSQYFSELPGILRKFDHLVYHALSYRDYVFGAEHGLTAASLIPNGADDVEFDGSADRSSRRRLAIADESLIVMTVGTLNGMKGHQELAEAFRLMQMPGKHATLVLNGNPQPAIQMPRSAKGLFAALCGNARSNGWAHTGRVVIKRILAALGVKADLRAELERLSHVIGQESDGEKRVILCDLPRAELVKMYLEADLFVLASRVEYSPLVLFEACAAGLPFLSAPAGNADEITAWTGGGEIYAAGINAKGFARTDPVLLSKHMAALLGDPARRKVLGDAGREACRRRFNWNALASEYEALFGRLVTHSVPVQASARQGHQQ